MTSVNSSGLLARPLQPRPNSSEHQLFVYAQSTGKLGNRARGRVITPALDERNVALRQTSTRCQAGLGQTSRKAQATERALPFADEPA